MSEKGKEVHQTLMAATERAQVLSAATVSVETGGGGGPGESKSASGENEARGISRKKAAKS